MFVSKLATVPEHNGTSPNVDDFGAYLLTNDRLKYLFLIAEEAIYNWVAMITNLDD
jgi:hypothetical protein